MNKVERKQVAVGYMTVIIESEAGWGTKPDGYMVGVSKEALDKRKVQFEERNTREYGLYYDRMSFDYDTVELSDSAVKALEESDTGTVWFNSTSQFVKGE